MGGKTITNTSKLNDLRNLTFSGSSLQFEGLTQLGLSFFEYIKPFANHNCRTIGSPRENNEVSGRFWSPLLDHF